MLTFTSKLCALSDTFYSLLLTLTLTRAGRNGISCPHMIQVKSVLWSYPLVQSVEVSVIKHHQLSYVPAFCCLSILPLVLEGGTGIRKYKIWSTLQMESENVLDFAYVYQHFQSGVLCWEEWKNLSAVSCTKWGQGATGRVHGQTPFFLNSRGSNEQANLQSFDLRMSLAGIKICLKFLLFSSAFLPFAFLCCVMNVSCPHLVTVTLCLKPH